ncbi:hypothetical protein [uncultured Sphingomonas sp.]|uniref:hypothetical protein n=1 Tax=uncultured Sphingomonas sp. TaxID=158754 RepID=UPI0035CAC5D2
MNLRRITGNLSTREGRFCRRWLEAASEMRDHLFADGEGFDPFRYNETATVGFLVAAAGRAGLLALPEFTEDHRKLPEGRVRAGRCDLWLASEDLSINWLLEFKLGWYGPRARDGLVTPMNKAIDCAFARDRDEADERWACVVYAPGRRWVDETPAERARWKSHATVDRLATFVDLAFEIGGPAGPAHVLLRRIPRGARVPERYKLDTDILTSGG